jgi:AraC-like DNA-binding protein
VCCLIGRENIHLTIEEILFEYWQNKLDNKLVLRYLLSILFIKMARAFVLHGRPSGIEYVSKAKAYIAENYDQPLSVDIIANYLGISYSYLASIFRQFGKRTIVAHINGVRIDRAVYMLTSSKASITDIAFAVGFNSRQHFTRVFKQRYGCSPMEYRKRYKSYYLNIAHK